MSIDIFSNQTLGVNRLFALVYSNQDSDSKRYKAKRYHLPKDIIKNYNATIIGKDFYDQSIDFYIKRYEVIRKLRTGPSEVYTTGCLLDHEKQNKVKIILLAVY